MTFNLGGGAGGLANFMDHLLGPVQTWWDDLGAPEVTPELQRRLIEGVNAEAGQRSIADLGLFSRDPDSPLAANRPQFAYRTGLLRVPARKCHAGQCVRRRPASRPGVGRRPQRRSLSAGRQPPAEQARAATPGCRNDRPGHWRQPVHHPGLEQSARAGPALDLD
ncbi:hypothetical protein G6F68_014234 [Rhizopus microsporus]|nr:hypothetical protein G6F68_014234 [Rhizopus microsporus]